jgi:hypothetical protein
MKHYKFTAHEIIGWMRICRPGMVIGPQQHYLQDIEQQMWYEGDMMRMKPSQQIRMKMGRTKGINPGIQGRTVEEQMYDSNSEAVRGREGQADALLSRRSNKGPGDIRQG